MQFENGTDVQFMNEYVQVVSQNLDVIMKNSFLLQAKYNVLEKALNHRISLEGQSTEQISELHRQISTVNEEKIQLLQQIESISGEKQRIQNGLNREMRDHAELQNKCLILDSEIQKINLQKLDLEKNLEDALTENEKMKILIASLSTPTPPKKIEQKPDVVSKITTKISKKVDVKSGGTF